MDSVNNTEFPQDRNFRIIAVNSAEAHAEIIRTLRRNGIIFNLQENTLSANGKYRSYTISATFGSAEKITQLSTALADVPFVKYVL